MVTVRKAAAPARRRIQAAVGGGMRPSVRIACRGVLVGLLLGLPAPPPPARAMSFVVTTTADAPQSGAPTACTTALGQCTLRAAIQAVNNLGGGPHVIFLQA